MMKMQMKRSPRQVMLCHCCCTSVCNAWDHSPHGAGIVSLPICCMHTVPDSEKGAALPLRLSLTSKQYKEKLAREALLLGNSRRQKSCRWYEADDGFCLSQGLSETTKDFARLMVTSEFAEDDLKSAVICRLHYGLKRE